MTSATPIRVIICSNLFAATILQQLYCSNYNAATRLPQNIRQPCNICIRSSNRFAATTFSELPRIAAKVIWACNFRWRTQTLHYLHVKVSGVTIAKRLHWHAIYEELASSTGSCYMLKSPLIQRIDRSSLKLLCSCSKYGWCRNYRQEEQCSLSLRIPVLRLSNSKYIWLLQVRSYHTIFCTVFTCFTRFTVRAGICTKFVQNTI